MVGGIVAFNNSTTITGVYTNASVIVEAKDYSSVKMGGIVAYTENEIKLSNAVNDAEKIEFIRQITLNRMVCCVNDKYFIKIKQMKKLSTCKRRITFLHREENSSKKE